MRLRLSLLFIFIALAACTKKGGSGATNVMSFDNERDARRAFENVSVNCG
ncbi:MAG: hypothetical protein HRT44_09465, partial [Bdellovibrionales bacterium]|nr:hypothetical protein [Bdellovibrionales bacterium]